jgi:methyl-accepting chemotaxis protein
MSAQYAKPVIAGVNSAQRRPAASRGFVTRLLGSMLLWQKLLLPLVALAAPAGVFAWMYLNTIAGKAESAQTALDVGRFADALDPMLIYVSDHRGQMGSHFRGEADAKGQALQSQERIDAQVAKIDAIDKEVGDRVGLSQSWAPIRTGWGDLKSRVFSLDETESRKQHVELIGKLTGAFHLLYRRGSVEASDSNQLLLMELVLDRLPLALAATADLRGRAASAVKGGQIPDKNKGQLLALLADVKARTAELEYLVPSEASADAETRALREALAAVAAANGAFISTLDTKVFSPETPAIAFNEVFSEGTHALLAMQEFASAGTKVLALRLEADLQAARKARTLASIIVVSLLLGAAIFAWLITRIVTRSVRETVSVLEHIGAGQLDNEIHTEGRDELAQLNRSLETMQTKLRQQIESERAQAAENARVRQALDKVSTSVVLADAHQHIIYLNDAAQGMFSRTQTEIRKALPSFEASRLSEQTLDALSTSPGDQRFLMDALNGSHSEDRSLGGCTFRVVANPVVNDRRERIGTVQEWTDRTPEVAVEHELQRMLSATLEGDLTHRIDVAGKSDFFYAMSAGVNGLADNLSELVSRVKIAAVEVSRGMDEISAGNVNLSQRTEEQSASLEETASSMEEMTSTVKQNSDNTAQANQLATLARGQADKGGHVVQETVRAMSSISESSKRIADIIGVIDEIAFQTNLLALNAAVEAARAGEQGRGFAVVASEVRNLAGRSAVAAKEIKELIQDSVRRVEHGSTLFTQSGQMLDEIVRSVKKVSDLVAEIDAAGREQSSGIEQVNRAVMQMDRVTQENAALVEEIAAASKSVAEQAQALNETMGRYRVLDDAGSANPPGRVGRRAAAA